MEIIETPQGRSVFYKGKTLLSKVAPKPSCEKLCAALPLSERTLYLCVSPLFGYGLQTLLEKMRPDSALFCVEKEEQLLSISRSYIPREITEHPRFLTEAALKAILQKGREFRRVVRFNLSGGFCFHADYYDELEKKLSAEITREWSNAATLMKLGRRYALNFMRNLRLLDKLPSASSINTIKSNKTIYVLGAGPSLDAFFEERRAKKTSRNEEIIVCADTALPSLAAHGLQADAVAALEAQHWNLRDFIGCRKAARALVMDMSALPASAEAIDKVYLFWTPWTHLNIFERLKQTGLLPLEMPPLGNVGITAYSLARRLFDATGVNIKTYGLDFSFTLDRYHCRGSTGHIDILRSQNRFNTIIPAGKTLRETSFSFVNAAGERLRSDPVMRGYAGLFASVKSGDAADNKNTAHGANSRAAGGALGAVLELRSELTRIRAVLQGKEKVPPEELAALIKRNDYLFAHFPDYAAREKEPDITDISFLKRLSAELGAFLKALDA